MLQYAKFNGKITTQITQKYTNIRIFLQAQKFIKLFSQARLNGYTSPQEHEENLALIGTISRKIGILEIILRNSIDEIMQAQNPKWLQSLPQDFELKKDKNEQNPTRDKIISMQSLGFWVRVVEHYKIHNQVFGKDFLDNLDLKKYCAKNPHHFYSTSIMRHHKVSAIIQLFRLIRNRAFHFENLYKITQNGYPRLNVKIQNKHKEKAYIAIKPSKITVFLDDLITNFDKDLITYARYYEDIKTKKLNRSE